MKGLERSSDFNNSEPEQNLQIAFKEPIKELSR